MKRNVSLLFVILVITMSTGLIPSAAQDTFDPAAWVPADFAGFVQLDVSDPADAVRGLNISLFVGSILQPQRLASESGIDFDLLFPLEEPFDMESAPFQSAVLPWLGDSMLVAYSALGPDFSPASEDVLLVLSTRDAFESASVLSTVFQAQDLLEDTTYRGVTIYNADRVSIALTTEAVVIGTEANVQAALDARAGEADRLIDGDHYATIREQLSETDPIFVYLQGEAAANALGFAVGGDDRSAPLLAALGETVSALTDSTRTPERALLQGDVDALGVSLRPDLFLVSQLNIRAAFHTSELTVTPPEAYDAELLNYVPRSAFFVHAGPDARQAAYSAFAALPLVNFSGRVLGGFPVIESVGSAEDAVATPDSAAMQLAAETFLEALDAVTRIELDEDLLDRFDGSYILWMTPRPNNPTPQLNLPYDLLIAAQVDESDEVMETVVDLIEAIVPRTRFDDSEQDDIAFMTLATDSGDIVLQLAAPDADTILFGTGDAVALALRAGQGDNRLVEQARWQQFIEDGEPLPTIYVDFVGFYNVFLPIAGGAQSVPASYLGVTAQPIDDEYFRADATIYLPE